MKQKTAKQIAAEEDFLDKFVKAIYWMLNHLRSLQ